MLKDMPSGKIIDNYKDISKRILQKSLPMLSEAELDKAIDYSIQNNIQDSKMSIHNSYTNETLDTTILQMTNYILEKEPIMTAYGVLFKKHGTVPNPLYDLIQKFVDLRDKYKKEMFKYPAGTEMFKKYNLFQLLAKIDANALFGCLGQYSSIFYNIHVAGSTTTNGRSCISSAIMLFESFLSNNVKFGSLNEVITFIDNVVNEKRNFKDSDIIDENITLSEAYFKLMTTCGFEWIPDEEDKKIVWDIMANLSQSDLNRIYYKNNLYSFCDNKPITKAIEYILSGLVLPFLNPNKPPKEIKVELDTLYEIMKEFVYYPHQIIDKMDRVEMMIRDSVLITDTDSCIISLDAWYRYVLDKTYNIDMNIKRQFVNPIKYMEFDEFKDPICESVIRYEDPVLEYDFYRDEVVELQRSLEPDKVIPQDGLRHSIINIISYILGKLIIDYMENYASGMNSFDKEKGDRDMCLLIMKNEFLFKSILLTDGKKNYAAIKEVQEGHLIPEKERFSISGMSMNKSVLQEKTRDRLKSILYEDILNSEEIDQMKVLNDIVVMERDIYKSLASGETLYYKPVKIKPQASYDNPMRIQGIKAALVYNALRDKDVEAIDLEIRNAILIVKVDIDALSVEKIKYTYPDKYEVILELFKIEQFKGGIDSVALPINVAVPKWLLEFIDYNSIITDNVKTFPLESIGIHRLGSAVPHSNILKL